MTSVADVLAGKARWCVLHGDCLAVLASMPDESVHACVTDPPAGISFMSRAWDDDKGGRDVWIFWLTYVMREAFRVLKPGAYAFVWALPRTAHWTATAIENAGFEIRDKVDHLFGSGFPKNQDASKAVDAHMFAAWLEANPEAAEWHRTANMLDSWVRQLPPIARDPEWNLRIDEALAMVAAAYGYTREVVHSYTAGGNAGTSTADKGGTYGVGVPNSEPIELSVTRGATPEAKQWDGWGTALKPGKEEWILARKPLIGTLAENLLEHGTGAINIDACRVATDWETQHPPSYYASAGISKKPEAEKIAGIPAGNGIECHPGGRWPPNVVFVHHALCERVGSRKVESGNGVRGSDAGNAMYGAGKGLARKTTGQAVGYASPDGTETVAAYSCHPSCPVRELERQSGVRTSGALTGQLCGKTGGADGYNYGTRSGVATFKDADTGTAARFFPQFEINEEELSFIYAAKASRSEREAGLSKLPARSGAEATGSKEGQARLNSPRTGAGRSASAIRNVHPTVKSAVEKDSVMRFLVRMITPPDGVCLDMFTGSGSTGVACVKEERRFIGIEQSDTDAEPYVSIARARIAYHEKQGVQRDLFAGWPMADRVKLRVFRSVLQYADIDVPADTVDEGKRKAIEAARTVRPEAWETLGEGNYWASEVWGEQE